MEAPVTPTEGIDIDATSLPAPALAAEPETRLAWLMGRAAIDGLDPANIY